MRELLLLATIILGQLVPNASFLSQMEKRLRLEPKAPNKNEQTLGRHSIIVGPTKTKIDDYTATAQAVYSVDLASNETLVSKDTDKRLQIASLTKLMTAYVILKEEEELSQILPVPTLNPQIGDSVVGLTTGDSLTVLGLLDGLLINSGSDAAQTLAIGNAGTVEAFVTKMNTAAESLSLTNTHFTNPVGWDDTNNYSSAKDLAELTRILLRNDKFVEIVRTKSKTVYTTAGRALPLASTNQLLSTPGYVGVKTGYTFGAGECLVSLYQEDDRQILTTVIGSGARFIETDTIKGWIIDHFSW